MHFSINIEFSNECTYWQVFRKHQLLLSYLLACFSLQIKAEPKQFPTTAVKRFKEKLLAEVQERSAVCPFV